MSESLQDLLALYDAEAPLARAFTIPSAWYVDERISRLEREQIFGNNWIAVGRTDQVDTVGQFFTFDLAGEPLVIVRGADKRLRAFFNVCRHHAAAVATAPCGVTQLLRCPYHGWTYGLESVAVSDRVQAEDVDICESVQRGLHSRAYRAGRLSVRREGGEHLFHRLLAADLKRR